MRLFDLAAHSLNSLPQVVFLLQMFLLQITKSDGFAMTTKMTKVASWITNIPPAPPQEPSVAGGSSTMTMPPRSGHVAFRSKEGDNYIFGGYVEADGDRYATNDLWRWDDTAIDWILCDSQHNVPGPRLVSAAAVVDDRYV